MKRLVKTFINYPDRTEKKIAERSLFYGKTDASYKDFGEGIKVGIIHDHLGQHEYYLKACHELKVGYKVFDLRKSEWMKEIIDSGLNKFLIWPSLYLLQHRYLLDNRIWFMVNKLEKEVFPGGEILWLYESKARTADWLSFHDYPMPHTKVFFDKKEALSYLRKAAFPLVLKTDQGAAASGVYILENASQTAKLVNRAFTYGIGMKNQPLYLRHSGYVIIQKYLPNVEEWRIIRVGDDFFCRKKVKKGDFHSGSGSIQWAKPPEELLTLTKKISDDHNFKNVNIDYFETNEGKYLINELHALWGGKELEDDTLEGRYFYDNIQRKWNFEKGSFFKNRCANLRVKYFLEN